MKKIVINSRQEMANLAKEIALQTQIGDIIGLKGTLGAGKSFFAKNCYISRIRSFQINSSILTQYLEYIRNLFCHQKSHNYVSQKNSK